MKRKGHWNRQILLAVILCILAQGCAGKEDAGHGSWSFQASGQSQDGESGGNAAQSQDGRGTDVPDGGSNETDRRTEDDAAVQVSVTEEEPAQETEAAGGYVYVCGAVREPGVYEIYDGMRVFEALQLAGGMTEDADPDWVNQAQCVVDGQKLQIYTKEETEQMRGSGLTDGSGEHTSDGAAAGDKVNINTADMDELMTLPGIGEAKAEAIIRYRQEHGAFEAIEEICEISGIKEAVFSNIRDRITV